MSVNKKIINLPDLIGKGYGEFWKTKKFFRVVKGGRGSKKSTTIAMWYIYNLMKIPLSNVVCVRKTANTNRDSTFAELKKACIRYGVYDKWKFTENPLEATYLPTKQKILFRGFDDPLKLTSMAVEVGYLCWVWFEEAYELESEDDFDTFVESIRGKMPEQVEGLFKQITISYNPWVNSHWTKPRFWDCECPDNVFRLTTTHKCNEWLDEEDHQRIEDLAITNPDRYLVVGLGEYGIPGGAYFDEFRTDIHVIEPFVIPQDWKRYITIDYGLDMLAVLWIAVDTHNKAYCYKELHQSNLIVSDAANAILDKTKENEKIYQTFAPPDLWNRNRDTGKSTAEIMGECGLWLTKADNNRIQGWYNVKEWLKPYQDEQETMTASLVIFKDRCPNLIRNLPQIQCDEKDPNDCATQPHGVTHICDSLRYFLSGRPSPTIVARVQKKSLLSEKFKKKAKRNAWGM